MTRWESPISIEEVLHKLAATAKGSQLEGYTSDQINEWERWKVATHGMNDPYLMPLESAGWRKRSGADIQKHLKYAPNVLSAPAPDWDSCLTFVFAASSTGEEVAYYANPPVYCSGLIACWFGITPPPGLMLGNSLGQWLDRLNACKGYEYAFTPAEIDQSDFERQQAAVNSNYVAGLDEPLRTQFLQDHIRLNPEDALARRLLLPN